MSKETIETKDLNDPSVDLSEYDVPAGKPIHPFGVYAAIAAAVPFVVQVRTTSTTVVDGVQTVQSTDPVATIAGAVAIIAGAVVGVAAARKDPRAKSPISLGLAAAGVGLGIYHLLGGLGVI